MFLAPKSHQNLLCKVFRNEVLKQCHPQHKLTHSRLSCDYLLLCCAGRNVWMLMLILGKGIKGWSLGPEDWHRFNISGSRNYLFQSPCGPRLFGGPIAAGLDPASTLSRRLWWCCGTWTTELSTQGRAEAKQGSNPARKSALPSQRSLCPGEHRGQGDGRHKWWEQGVSVVSHISQHSQKLLTSRVPLILTQKTDLWFQICWGKFCMLIPLMYSQNQGSAFFPRWFQGSFSQVKR